MSRRHPSVVFAHLDPGFSGPSAGHVLAMWRLSSSISGGNPRHASVSAPDHATKNCFGRSSHRSRDATRTAKPPPPKRSGSGRFRGWQRRCRTSSHCLPVRSPGLSGGDISPVALDHHERSGGHGIDNVLFIERSVNAFHFDAGIGARHALSFGKTPQGVFTSWAPCDPRRPITRARWRRRSSEIPPGTMAVGDMWWNVFASKACMFLRALGSVMVLIVLSLIGLTYYTTVVLVYGPLASEADSESSEGRFATAVLVVYHALILMVLWSYFACVLTEPGRVRRRLDAPPPTDERGGHASAQVQQREASSILCKCTAWKPERCHHCSVCGRCVLKMDHHCVWVANCVGAYNYKFFLLFLLYTFVATVFDDGGAPVQLRGLF